MRVLILIAAVASAAACGGTTYKRSYAEPSVSDVLSHLEKGQRAATSVVSESIMDYWVKSDRVKGTVLLMGKPGSRLRFNAENPTGGNVAVDLACDGVGYKLIDYNNNCQMVGPCTASTIAQLFAVEMAPDDFYLMAVGSTPIIPEPTGTVTWNAKKGTETIKLSSADGQWRQVIVLDGKQQRWDVLSSTVYDANGDVEWKLQNKEFRGVEAADGVTIRVPAKSKFEQPKRKADLLVRWKKFKFNVELGPEKFDMQIPPGLAVCQ